jgi:hypothetical protein
MFEYTGPSFSAECPSPEVEHAAASPNAARPARPCRRCRRCRKRLLPRPSWPAPPLRSSPLPFDPAVPGWRVVRPARRRLPPAIAVAPDVSVPVAALKDREQRRLKLQNDLAVVESSRAVSGFDVSAVEADLRAQVENWRAFLKRQTPIARQTTRSAARPCWTRSLAVF